MWERVAKQVLAHLKSAKRPLLAVLGPTASGKTDASISIALGIGNCEIVNADSRQLYRGLDIGTAKIRPDEMRGVSHHLIDVLDPQEELTIAKYKELATASIDDILARGNIPMLVGGSMLYVSAVIDNLQPPPAADAALRARIQDEYDKDGGKTLHAKLEAADPETAATIDYRNKPSVVRAAEILELTGMAPSAVKTRGEGGYDVLAFLLEWPREKIVERINFRTKKLINDGWVEEVKGLLDAGVTIDDPAMKSHGYREIAQAILDGTDMADVEAVIAKKTRDYAKRQVTWWRNDERLVRILMP